MWLEITNIPQLLGLLTISTILYYLIFVERFGLGVTQRWIWEK